MQRADTLKHILPMQPCIPPTYTKISYAKTVTGIDWPHICPFQRIKMHSRIFFFSPGLHTVYCGMSNPDSIFEDNLPHCWKWDHPRIQHHHQWLSELWCLVSCGNSVVNPTLPGSISSPLFLFGLSLSKMYRNSIFSGPESSHMNHIVAKRELFVESVWVKKRKSFSRWHITIKPSYRKSSAHASCLHFLFWLPTFDPLWWKHRLKPLHNQCVTSWQPAH